MAPAGSRGPAPLPASLGAAERDFYKHLRNTVQLTGLSQRQLEQLTESAGSAGHFSKSAWGRALNGLARPPLHAVRALAAHAAGGAHGEALPGLWARAFAESPPESPPDPQVRPRQLPAAVTHFTGREAELGALARLAAKAATGGESVVITAISGTAGVGKTALALHWAHRAAGTFPDGQLYVNLRGFDPSGSPADPDEVLHGFAEALGVPASQVPSGAQALAGLYRSLMAGRRVLVVLDNARDAAQVRPLLPGTAGSLVLVTSRSQMAGLAAAEGAHLLAVDVLGNDEAGALLAIRLGADRTAAEPEAVREITAACAALPLALNIAAARAAAQPEQPLSELAAALRDQQARLDQLDTGDPAASARPVLSWSYESLSAPAAEMFRLLGLHPGPDVTPAAAGSLAGVPAGQARLVLRELAGAHMLTEHRPGRFAFHDLLRAYAGEQAAAATSAPRRQEALSRVLSHYAHAAHAAAALICPGRDLLELAPAAAGVTPEQPGDGPAALAWFAAEQPVLAACVRAAADNGLGGQGWQLGWLLGRYLHRRGAWQEWAAVLQATLAAAAQAGDMPGQAYARRDLGAACAALGSRPGGGQLLQQAEDHLQQAMSIYRQAGDAVGQAHVHLYLGHLREVQDRVSEMLPHELAALELFRAAGHAAGQANALTNAAVCYRKLGDYPRSLDSCLEALELHQQAGNRDGEGHTWMCLGLARRQLAQDEEAVACGQRSVAVFRDLANRPLLARALTQLGDTLHTAGNRDGARTAWQEAFAIFDKMNDPEAAALSAKLA